MFVDSHCHLNDERLKDQLPDLINRAHAAGVTRMVTICTDMVEAPDVLKIAHDYDNIMCSIGVHPHEAKPEMDKGDLKNRILPYLSDKKVIALGETGLDYYYENSPKEEQQQSFQIHIDLNKEHQLPLVVHTRDAEQDTIDMLKNNPGCTGVIHCFSGTQWLADQALDLGFYISVSGIVTFKKSEELRDVIKNVPLDRLLVETDSPYLAPAPHRGKTCEPAYTAHTAQMVADLKNVTTEEIAALTTRNFGHLFQRS